MQTFQISDIFFIKTKFFQKLLEMLKPRHDGVAAVKRILSVKTVKHDFPFMASFVERAFAIVNWYKSVIKPFIFIPPFFIYVFSRLIDSSYFPHHGNRSFPSVQDNTSPFLVIRHF